LRGLAERASRLADALPIEAILPEVLAALQRGPNLVLEAAPGAGKTTRIPAALLGLVQGEVLVLEPRRIAARMAARRVAAEMGEEVGETVGYQVRFEEKSGPRTRLRFVTEGILTRRLASDPLLRGVDAVVLDEFHERHLETDLALALLKRLQGSRPELRIVVMSATLEGAAVAAYLGGCAVLRSEGRQYPLTVRYLGYSPKTLAEQVRDAVEMLEAEGHTGSTLVFVPGAAEIRQVLRECEAVTQRAGVLALPLHGELSPAEQDRAVQPSRERKLIVATNVAESSVTVAGVTAVIDSGLARRSAHSPWTGLATLQVGRISRAAATQRAGRAGRIAAGTVLRLYAQEDFQLRPAQETPEILRADLAQLLLALRAMGIAAAGELAWLDTPTEAAVANATALLDRLGARGAMAEKMARLPLPPRLARMVMEAEVRGVGEMGCRVAALLSGGARLKHQDLLEALDEPMDERTRMLFEQLLRVVRPSRGGKDEQALLLAVLAGFPDRVARRRVGNEVQLANGVMAEAMGAPPQYEFLVALDAEDRAEGALPLVRLTARVEPEWLLEVFPEAVVERTSVEWHRGGERVERVSSLLYGELVLEETRRPALDQEGAALLARKALDVGIEGFVDAEALGLLRARLRFAGLGDVNVERAVRELSGGLTSFAQLREAAARDLLPLLESGVDARRLQELAPTTLKLAGGRSVKVHYEEGRTPWISSRLQDFFGMKETPRLGAERVSVVVHLLAPNQRAVQTTTDLAGFWERLYPEVRRELMRRYPRHQWPETV
jgi:ATP-dependent helicase HrpB